MKKLFSYLILILALLMIGYLIVVNENARIAILSVMIAFTFAAIICIAAFNVMSADKKSDHQEVRPYFSDPKPKEHWRHRNGNMYEVLFIANTGHRNKAYPVTVVYAGTNDLIWTRPLSDWHRSMTLVNPFNVVV